MGDDVGQDSILRINSVMSDHCAALTRPVNADEVVDSFTKLQDVWSGENANLAFHYNIQAIGRKLPYRIREISSSVSSNIRGLSKVFGPEKVPSPYEIDKFSDKVARLERNGAQVTYENYMSDPCNVVSFDTGKVPLSKMPFRDVMLGPFYPNAVTLSLNNFGMELFFMLEDEMPIHRVNKAGRLKETIGSETVAGMDLYDLFGPRRYSWGCFPKLVAVNAENMFKDVEPSPDSGRTHMSFADKDVKSNGLSGYAHRLHIYHNFYMKKLTDDSGNSYMVFQQRLSGSQIDRFNAGIDSLSVAMGDPSFYTGPLLT